MEKTAWLALLEKQTAMSAALGMLDGGCPECHDLCVGVYANLKSAYRKEPSMTRRIREIPPAHATPTGTLERMRKITKARKR